MTQAERNYQYTEDFNTALQWMWGDGYLSPGGPEEVAEMLHDVAVSGCYVLDVGSGLGAIDITLVETYGANGVHGVDVEPHLIKHADQRAAKAGMQDRVKFQLIDPGPLPFANNTFDIVFSKDAIVHIPDKPAFYTEAKRVLKPGGLFVGSDWLRGDENTFTPKAQEWLEFVHLNFQMRNIEQTRQALEQAGFDQVKLSDRNEWYKDTIKDELATLSGEKYEQLASMIGTEQAEYRLKSSQLKQEAIEAGFLRPTHFVCHKS